jgi:hypothetical protein
MKLLFLLCMIFFNTTFPVRAVYLEAPLSDSARRIEFKDLNSDMEKCDFFRYATEDVQCVIATIVELLGDVDNREIDTKTATFDEINKTLYRFYVTTRRSLEREILFFPAIDIKKTTREGLKYISRQIIYIPSEEYHEKLTPSDDTTEFFAQTLVSLYQCFYHEVQTTDILDCKHALRLLKGKTREERHGEFLKFNSIAYKTILLHGIEGLRQYAYIVAKCGAKENDENNKFNQLLEAAKKLHPLKSSISRPPEKTLMSVIFSAIFGSNSQPTKPTQYPAITKLA